MQCYLVVAYDFLLSLYIHTYIQSTNLYENESDALYVLDVFWPDEVRRNNDALTRSTDASATAAAAAAEMTPEDYAVLARASGRPRRLGAPADVGLHIQSGSKK